MKGVDLKYPEFKPSSADEFYIGDLRDRYTCEKVFGQYFDEVYQLAADMGGAGYLFTGDSDAAIMHNSAQINLHAAEFCRLHKIPKFSIPLQLVFIPNIISSMQETLIVKKVLFILLSLIANTDGKNYSVNGSI